MSADDLRCRADHHTGLLLRNTRHLQTGNGSPLEGDTSNRSAIGALIVVEATTDGKTGRQIREVSTHSGWRSQGELTQHFGLGAATAVSKVEIKWPSGYSQIIVDPPINQILNVREGR